MNKPLLLSAWIGWQTGMFLCGTAAASPFYVSPHGNDANPGTAARPFATLTRARNAARKLPAGASRIIRLENGNYYNVFLALGPRDSGLTIEAVPGAHPVLFGGQPVRGWRPDGAKFFAAPLPPFPSIGSKPKPAGEPARWEVRLLEVNGTMRPRARYPAKGRLTHLSTFNVPWMSSTGGGWKRKPTRQELTTLKYKPGDLGPWFTVSNAELTVYHMWDESTVGIVSNDVAHHVLKLNPPTGHPPGAFGVHQYVVWNIRRGMTRPGQWYQDRTRHRLVYWPLPGERMSQARVMAPTRTTILKIAGTRSRKVRGITVRHLTFAVTTVPLMAAGFAASRYPAALAVSHAADCRFSRLVIRDVAGHAIDAHGDVAGIRVANCQIGPCGAGGIYVGGSDAVISNNLVHAIGVLYPSGIGIFRGGRDNRVTHNEVHDCSYTGINYGGISNVIDANLIYDCMKSLHDGGAIYLFAGQHCVVRGNFVHDIRDTGGYGASAYYLDERCEDCRVEGNLSLRVHWPSHNHMATNNIIRNNFFIVQGNAKWTFPRSWGYRVEHNVLMANGTIRIENPAAVRDWSGNWFYSKAGKIEQIRLSRYSPVGTMEGPPPDSQTSDPRIEVEPEGVVRVPSNSAAAKSGIEPLDVHLAGRLVGPDKE